ncbi:hypothetical protein J932_2420 [Acinetobacter baumannii 44437_9]|nr:hypothetical protein J932_2420 [Acinetobacter baumannii 44437_9]
MRQSQQGQDLHPKQHAVLHLMKQFLFAHHQHRQGVLLLHGSHR